MHELGYDAYRLDAIPQDIRKEYEEKRRRAVKPLISELREAWANP